MNLSTIAVRSAVPLPKRSTGCLALAQDFHGHRVECCGFGGLFSVVNESVSAKMGSDKVQDFARAKAEYIVSADSSCIMHQRGCAERDNVPIKVIHIAQILNGAAA
jgi:Fe-S oxidoreductase